MDLMGDLSLAQTHGLGSALEPISTSMSYLQGAYSCRRTDSARLFTVGGVLVLSTNNRPASRSNIPSVRNFIRVFWLDTSSKRIAYPTRSPSAVPAS